MERTEIYLCEISQFYVKILHARVISSRFFYCSRMYYMDILWEILYLMYNEVSRGSTTFFTFLISTISSSEIMDGIFNICTQFMSYTDGTSDKIYISRSSKNNIRKQAIRSSGHDNSGSNFVWFQFILSAIETRNSNQELRL